MKFANVVCCLVAVALVGFAVAQEGAEETKSAKKGSCCASKTNLVSEEGKSCSNCPSAQVAAVGEKSCSGCSSTKAVAAKTCAGSGCTASAVASDEKSCSQCPVGIAMSKLPKMTYKVGDKSMCCSKAAATLAKEQEKPVHFVVADKTFESKDEAYTALVETTEKFVNEFITPSKCEKSGLTTVAGKSCGCPVQSSENVELVKNAVNKVKMTYVVGEEKCECPMKAKDLAAKSDAKMTYVVDGKESCCNLEARMNFAKAKYAAAVKAVVASQQKTETKGSENKEKAGT